MWKMMSTLFLAYALLAGPQYTPSGEMKFPADYREWVYLSSGLDMSYAPTQKNGSSHVFDNVFVNREAYSSFVQSGHWPDKTTFVLELRRGESRGSINQAGAFQGELESIEVHVKDNARFKGSWAFYSFDGGKVGKLLQRTESCYSCHEEHGAVETTFVQFYPTLIKIAQAKGTAKK